MIYDLTFTEFVKGKNYENEQLFSEIFHNTTSYKQIKVISRDLAKKEKVISRERTVK